ncbi:MAG: hypothetical protein KC635_24930 [Myxococcales bacterium]|nr:hypothetical protein [Myxococcales bacterium]MCB9734341.1 hypothetical protein [Deltaproteobacteria bacterium]
MNVDALPIPKLYSPAAMNPWNIKGLSKFFGIALLAVWIVPWLKVPGGIVWPWTYFKLGAFEAIWSLLAGGALVAVGFVKPGTLKLGHMIVGGAGIGFLGIVSITTGVNMPLGYTFPLLGLLTVSISLFLWARGGHTQILWIATIVGLVFMLLGLLIPVPLFGVGPSDLPLLSIFKVFSAGAFILGAIFYLIFGLLYLGIMAAAVMFVVLPQKAADMGWVRLIGVVSFLYLPALYLIVGLFFFNGFPLLGLHKIVELVVYGWLLTVGAVSIYDAQRDGTLKSWF